jgi:hypothetical protein
MTVIRKTDRDKTGRRVESGGFISFEYRPFE